MVRQVQLIHVEVSHEGQNWVLRLEIHPLHKPALTEVDRRKFNSEENQHGRKEHGVWDRTNYQFSMLVWDFLVAWCQSFDLSLYAISIDKHLK